MMSRLIDANALLEHLARCIEQSKGLMRSVCVAIKCFVEQMPAVEVIRCKDCKFLHEKGYCTLVTGLTRIEPDDYCSRGERRTDG